MKVAKSTNKTVKTSHKTEEKILGAVQIKFMVDGQMEMIPGLTQSNMNDFTWGELATLIKQGHADYFDPGDTKDIFLNLDTTYFTNIIKDNYKVVVLSSNHNQIYEGTNRVHFCLGRTTDNIDITFSGKSMNSDHTNLGGWAATEIRTFLNGAFFAALPSDLASVITPCTKYTDNVGGGTGNDVNNITPTEDKIWLPSEYEILGKQQFSNSHEVTFQEQYALFDDNTHCNYRYYHHNTANRISWWFRSPLRSNSDAFCAHSNNDSYINDYHRSALTFGVLPCFTIS